MSKGKVPGEVPSKVVCLHEKWQLQLLKMFNLLVSVRFCTFSYSINLSIVSFHKINIDALQYKSVISI